MVGKHISALRVSVEATKEQERAGNLGSAGRHHFLSGVLKCQVEGSFGYDENLYKMHVVSKLGNSSGGRKTETIPARLNSFGTR